MSAVVTPRDHVPHVLPLSLVRVAWLGCLFPFLSRVLLAFLCSTWLGSPSARGLLHGFDVADSSRSCLWGFGLVLSALGFTLWPLSCALVPPSWAPLKPRKRFRWLTRLHSRDGVIGTVGRAPPFGTHGNNRPSSNPLLASPEADRGKRWSVPRLTYRLLRWVGGRCVFSPKHISSRNLMESQRRVFFLLNTSLRCFLSGLASLFGACALHSRL